MPCPVFLKGVKWQVLKCRSFVVKKSEKCFFSVLVMDIQNCKHVTYHVGHHVLSLVDVVDSD